MSFNISLPQSAVVVPPNGLLTGIAELVARCTEAGPALGGSLLVEKVHILNVVAAAADVLPSRIILDPRNARQAGVAHEVSGLGVEGALVTVIIFV